jgi:zona occludens toxin (predicted ATPase)
VTAERLNVPAFSVMTERFSSAAEMMSRVLGQPGYAFAVIGHPMSSATDAELKEMARIAIEQGSKLLVKS